MKIQKIKRLWYKEFWPFHALINTHETQEKFLQSNQEKVSLFHLPILNWAIIATISLCGLFFSQKHTIENVSWYYGVALFGFFASIAFVGATTLLISYLILRVEFDN